MSKWDKPLPIFFAVVIAGYLATAYGQFQVFVIIALAFIFAKHFER